MSNLRDRLRRIQEQKSQKPIQMTIDTGSNEKREKDFYLSALTKCGWESCGYCVLKRKVNVKSPYKSIKTLPFTLPVLIPDLRSIKLPSIENFIFFDLETTGLSSGSGTVAFLAAFGQKISNLFQITQYLLLDYPGLNDFLENVLSHFSNNEKIIVSFNGKCFDSQILKTMCIMNRIPTPEYFHVDLLHPARRLWKRIINNCSQSSIETNILGLDRSGDISGALAPEIWFDFIKTGKTEKLNQICDHNKADITGLASILSAMIDIAKDPLNVKYKFDIEKLALYWRKYSRISDNNPENEIIKKGNKLLKYAAEEKYPKAVYIYGYDQMKNNNYSESLKFVNFGLKLFEKDTIWHKKLIRRAENLKRKINRLNKL